MPPLSAYDEPVPHPPADARAAERFARLRELRAPYCPPAAGSDPLSRVVRRGQTP